MPYNIFISFFIVLVLINCKTLLANDIDLDTVTLQLKWKHQFQFAGYYAAIEKGYYHDAGLVVNLVEAVKDEESTTRLLRGKAEFGISTSDIAVARSKGMPVVVLACIFQHSPEVFLALNNGKINNVHELYGKKIMLEPHSAQLIAYLQSEGIPVDKIDFVPHSLSPDDLINGSVDAMSAYLTDETFYIEQKGYDYLIFTPRAAGIDFYGDLLFTTQTQIENHPERVKAFLEASLKGWEYAQNHIEEIVDLIIAKYSKEKSREYLLFEAQKMKQLIVGDIIEIGYINPGRWEYIINTYHELGMIKEKYPIEEFVYNRNPERDFTWLYLSLLGVVSISGIITIYAIRYYRLVYKLRRESYELIKTEKQWRAAEEKYRILAEHAPFAIIISKYRDGEILYINSQASQMFNITKELAIGRNIKDFYDNLKVREKICQILETHGFLKNHEVLLHDVGKVLFWASMSATIIQFDDEKANFVGIIDITERKKLEENLKLANATKDRFFSIIAHDLRNPIGNFKGMIEMIIDSTKDSKLDPKITKMLSAMYDSAKSTFLLLENLLIWSRSQKGELGFNPENILLKPLFDEVLELFTLAIEKKHITIEKNIDDDLMAYTDTDILSAVARNILGNAVKFTATHGRIFIKAEEIDQMIEIQISDSGVGIEPSRLNHLFDESVIDTTKGTDNEKGSGLGLKLCKELIERNKGEIRATSIPDEGSTFVFTVPVQ